MIVNKALTRSMSLEKGRALFCTDRIIEALDSMQGQLSPAWLGRA